MSATNAFETALLNLLFTNIVPGEKFAVILTTGTGTVYYNPFG